MVKEGQRWPKMEMTLLGLEPSSDSLENSQIRPMAAHKRAHCLPHRPTSNRWPKPSLLYPRRNALRWPPFSPRPPNRKLADRGLLWRRNADDALATSLAGKVAHFVRTDLRNLHPKKGRSLNGCPNGARGRMIPFIAPIPAPDVLLFPTMTQGSRLRPQSIFTCPNVMLLSAPPLQGENVPCSP